MNKVQPTADTVKSKRSVLALGTRRASVKLMGAALMLCMAAACSSPEQKMEKYTAEGLAYLESGDLGRANIQFQNALKINEEHVPALEGMVNLAEGKSDFKSMFAVLQTIVRLEPNNLDAQVKLGKLYLVASDETTALEHADIAFTLDADDIDANTLKAAIQLKLGDNAGAVELARGVIARDPANPEAITVLATERTVAGEFEEALAEIDTALSVKSDIAILQLLRISLLQRLDRSDDVTAAYKGLIDIFPEEAAYRRVYATDLIQREDFAPAATQLEAIVGLEPDNLEAKLDVVRINLKQGGEKAAIARLEQYVDENPDNVDLKFALISFLRQQKNIEGVDALLATLASSEDDSVVLKAKNQMVVELLRKGEREQADALVKEILEADEYNTEALIKRAGLLINDGSYDSAILDLRAALDNSPDSAEAMVLMGMAFEQQDNPSFARTEFVKAFEASGQDSNIGEAFAKFHLRQKDVKRAEQVLVESLAVHPGDVDNLRLLAGVRLSQQDWRGAEEVAEILARVENQDALAERVRSAAFAGLGDYDQMIESLTAQNENEPLASRPLATLVSAYLRTDRGDEAQELLQRIITTEEDNYSAHILSAQVHGTNGDAKAAEDVLLAAIESDPSKPEAFELLYRYYQRGGEPEKAIQLIEDGLAVAPQNTALRVFKADALLNNGDLEQAFGMYEKLVAERPENKVVANNFVSLSSDLRQDPASIAKALEVAKTLQEEENPLFKDTVGWAYYRAGDFDKAVELLSVAEQGANQNAEIIYHLGAAYFAVGDTVNAKVKLDEALNAGGNGFRYADEINVLLGRL